MFASSCVEDWGYILPDPKGTSGGGSNWFKSPLIPDSFQPEWSNSAAKLIHTNSLCGKLTDMCLACVFIDAHLQMCIQGWPTELRCNGLQLLIIFGELNLCVFLVWTCCNYQCVAGQARPRKWDNENEWHIIQQASTIHGVWKGNERLVLAMKRLVNIPEGFVQEGRRPVPCVFAGVCGTSGRASMRSGDGLCSISSGEGYVSEL